LGYHLDEQQLQRVFEGFRRWRTARRKCTTRNIEALAETQMPHRPGAVDAGGDHVQRRLGDDPVGGGVPVAQRGPRTTRGGHRRRPVDAVFKAIERITGIELELRNYNVRSVTVGEDAQGEAHVEVVYKGNCSPAAP